MISIVVPVYNGEKYIERCVNSILAQTYLKWELILIDNGSTDNSYDVCKKYAHIDERIFVLHQHRNQGVSVARNLGKEKVNGEFITFIDADDCIKPDYLENLINIQKKEEADMVICGYKTFTDGGETAFLQKENKNYPVKRYDLEHYLQQYLLEGNTHCWGVLYHKELLEEVTFPKGITIGEDLLFLIDAAFKAKRIAVTEYQGYGYYINESGAMKKRFTPSYMDQVVCWQMAADRIAERYPKLQDKLDSILVVSAMLVVGKISELEKEEQNQYTKELEQCRAIVKQYAGKKEVSRLLPGGYSIKCLVYRYAPGIYLKLYGARKRGA